MSDKTTISSADNACPYVAGADARISCGLNIRPLPSKKGIQSSGRRDSGAQLPAIPTDIGGRLAVGEEEPEATATTIPSLFRQTTQTGDTPPVAELGKPEQRQVNITSGQFESMRLEAACKEDKQYARPVSVGFGKTGLPGGGCFKGENMGKCNAINSTQHDYTFNFWVGCHKLSEGCKNCYMFLAQGRRPWTHPNEVKLCTSTWKNPMTWQRKAEKAGEYKSVFACSYSDFFLPEADAWRNDAWALIRRTPNLIWQLASKRTHLIADRLPPDWGEGYKNVWLGTSAELKKYLYRLNQLREIPCVLRWVDFAPTLEDLMPELSEHIDGFGWLGVSGETGCGLVEPRPFNVQWARNVRDLCKEKGIPFRFGHVAGRPRYPDRHLDGVIYSEIPPLMPKSEDKPGGCVIMTGA